MAMASSTSPAIQGLRHLRQPRPLVFSPAPPELKVNQKKRHWLLCTFLFEVLESAFGKLHSIGADQAVYWNASDPRRVCGPDAFVKLGIPDTPFDLWKTWEHGAPELVVEITSPYDQEPLVWEEKLARYHEMGAKEVVRFDWSAELGSRIRVWDRVEGDLVERKVENDATPCVTLGGFWVVAPARKDLPVALRLAHDIEGRELFPSPADRIAQLEEELRRRG
jgi:hypothetical protein